MTDDNTEIKRTEWSQGAFIEVWEDDEQQAAIPEGEAQRIGEAAGMVPVSELEALADEWYTKNTTGKFGHAAKELRELIAEHKDD